MGYMSTIGYTGIEPGIPDPRVFDKPRICSSRVEEVKYSKNCYRDLAYYKLMLTAKSVPQSLQTYGKQTKCNGLCLFQVLVVCPWHFAVL